MAYGVIMCCHLHMPLYILGTFTEYPHLFFILNSSFLFFIFLCFHLGFFRIVRIDVIDRS